VSGAFVAAVLRRFTPGTLAVAVIALPALVLVGGMGLASPIWGAQASTQLARLYENVVVALAVFVAVIVADEAVDRGAPRLATYAFAVGLGSIVGALLGWHTHGPLGFEFGHGIRDAEASPVFVRFHVASIAVGAALVGGLATFVHAGRRTALDARRRQHTAEQARAQAQRRKLESQLQALQARVEPMFLFGSLERIRSLYRTQASGASSMMEDLIVYLRAALPHLRESTSTVAQELTLVRAWLDIVGRSAPGWRFEPEVDAAALSGRLPALLLLPLVQHAAADRGGAPVHLRLRVQRDGSALAIELVTSTDAFAAGVAGQDLLEQLRERLLALYAGRASLGCGRAAGGATGSRAVVEMPFEVAAEDRKPPPENA
jgi:Histidine kinase